MTTVNLNNKANRMARDFSTGYSSWRSIGVSSRFYPPPWNDGPRWEGHVSVVIAGGAVASFRVWDKSLEGLRAKAEALVSEIRDKVLKAAREALEVMELAEGIQP